MKGTLNSMERADSVLHPNLAFVITVYLKMQTAPFFLCKELIPGYLDGITGEYTTPQGYFVDENEAEEFDKRYPVKEKLKLPGQLV